MRQPFALRVSSSAKSCAASALRARLPADIATHMQKLPYLPISGARTPARRAPGLFIAQTNTVSLLAPQVAPALRPCWRRFRPIRATHSALRAGGGRWRGSTRLDRTSSLRASCCSGAPTERLRRDFQHLWRAGRRAEGRAGTPISKAQPEHSTRLLASAPQLVHAPAARGLDHAHPPVSPPRGRDPASRRAILRHVPDSERCASAANARAEASPQSTSERSTPCYRGFASWDCCRWLSASCKIKFVATFRRAAPAQWLEIASST